MPRKAPPVTADISSRSTLVLSSRTRRARITQELVNAGIAHGRAEVMGIVYSTRGCPGPKMEGQWQIRHARPGACRTTTTPQASGREISTDVVGRAASLRTLSGKRVPGRFQPLHVKAESGSQARCRLTSTAWSTLSEFETSLSDHNLHTEDSRSQSTRYSTQTANVRDGFRIGRVPHPCGTTRRCG